MIRFGINVRKCAVLVALSEGCKTVSLRHELIAIEAAEEWLNNIFAMVEQTTATAFTRSVDDVERFIAQQRNSEVRLEKVYARFNNPFKYTDEWVAQLVKEGRIAKSMNRDESFTLKLKRQGAALPEAIAA